MTKFIRRKFEKEKSPLRRNYFLQSIRGGSLTLNIILLVLIVFAGLSYLYYTNQTATGGFEIKGLESSIEELQKNNKKLELTSAELQSLAKIEEAVAGMEMVAVSKIEYLPAVGSVIAVK